MSWITTSTLMQRGNLAALMLGVVEFDAVLVDPEYAMTGAGDGAGERRISQAYQVLRTTVRAGWREPVNLTGSIEEAGARTDAEIAEVLLEALLATEIPAGTRSNLTTFLREQREALGVEEGELIAAGRPFEVALREAAQVILSLPEAQLN